jgi:hypothetical protein
MNTHEYTYIRPADVHAALARAHADRAEYVRLAITAVPALVKRLVTRFRPSRQRLPQAGVWA